MCFLGIGGDDAGDEAVACFVVAWGALLVLHLKSPKTIASKYPVALQQKEAPETAMCRVPFLPVHRLTLNVSPKIITSQLCASLQKQTYVGSSSPRGSPYSDFAPFKIEAVAAPLGAAGCSVLLLSREGGECGRETSRESIWLALARPRALMREGCVRCLAGRRRV